MPSNPSAPAVSVAGTPADLDAAEALVRAYGPVAEVGAYGPLIKAIASTLRESYNRGALDGMALTRAEDRDV